MIRAAVVALVLLLMPGAVDAQTPGVDPIRELLTEVRALRIAMERSATVGARIQLLVARVQLQEQRIAEVSRRAAAVRDEVSRVEASIAGLTRQLKQAETETERADSAERRKEGQEMVEAMKQMIAAPEKRRQDLLNEEASLSQQLAADQGRWSDVNSQLDELERSLMPPKP